MEYYWLLFLYSINTCTQETNIFSASQITTDAEPSPNQICLEQLDVQIQIVLKHQSQEAFLIITYKYAGTTLS